MIYEYIAVSEKYGIHHSKIRKEVLLKLSKYKIFPFNNILLLINHNKGSSSAWIAI
jgi:hypothetical protein